MSYCGTVWHHNAIPFVMMMMMFVWVCVCVCVCMYVCMYVSMYVCIIVEIKEDSNLIDMYLAKNNYKKIFSQENKRLTNLAKHIDRNHYLGKMMQWFMVHDLHNKKEYMIYVQKWKMWHQKIRLFRLSINLTYFSMRYNKWSFWPDLNYIP